MFSTTTNAPACAAQQQKRRSVEDINASYDVFYPRTPSSSSASRSPSGKKSPRFAPTPACDAATGEPLSSSPTPRKEWYARAEQRAHERLLEAGRAQEAKEALAALEKQEKKDRKKAHRAKMGKQMREERAVEEVERRLEEITVVFDARA
ncbi:Uu.00g003700.m01.CDS01 [Anthostomella pinea]|uniref:Uu.00g003700.m01.CDS01 n=1 Tax=Anthostomella pinea TaxID=933095 RepID=A0AAI8YIQ4_9PEZI|nr:Uu.00g003700.m01.CDS01 [Anthostomella pinea]